MRNHNEKARDMARSVLPSTRRKGARDDKANLKRRIRRHNTMRCAEWASMDDPYDYEGFMAHDMRYGSWGNIREIVTERRYGDKLSVVQWAEQKSRKQMPGSTGEERYNYFKKIFGDNLPGRHALGHVADVIHPLRNGFDRLYYVDNTDEDGYFIPFNRRLNVPRAPTDADIAKCHVILAAPGGHKRLNRALKNHYMWTHLDHKGRGVYPCDKCRVRLLLGMHNVEEFLNAIGHLTRTTVFDRFDEKTLALRPRGV